MMFPLHGQKVHHGVPQGSVIGPILFTLHAPSRKYNSDTWHQFLLSWRWYTAVFIHETWRNRAVQEVSMHVSKTWQTGWPPIWQHSLFSLMLNRFVGPPSFTSITFPRSGASCLSLMLKNSPMPLLLLDWTTATHYCQDDHIIPLITCS